MQGRPKTKKHKDLAKLVQQDFYHAAKSEAQKISRVSGQVSPALLEAYLLTLDRTEQLVDEGFGERDMTPADEWSSTDGGEEREQRTGGGAGDDDYDSWSDEESDVEEASGGNDDSLQLLMLASSGAGVAAAAAADASTPAPSRVCGDLGDAQAPPRHSVPATSVVVVEAAHAHDEPSVGKVGRSYGGGDPSAALAAATAGEVTRTVAADDDLHWTERRLQSEHNRRHPLNQR